MRLHITNGDSTVALMNQAGITDPILPWRDVLHDGHCLCGVSLREFSEHRAKFISGLSGTSLEQVRKKFADRDEVFERADDFEEIVLWFEHDLYDQLQLIQVLDLLQDYPGHLQLINTGTHLGMMQPQDFQRLIKTPSSVSKSQIGFSIRAWSAFCASQPMGLADLLSSNECDLPYLLPSIRRLLEEYPCLDTGLPRTETQILQRLRESSCSFGALFRDCLELEEAAYMGDWSFETRLEFLAEGQGALVEKIGKVFAITPLGLRVLNKQADWTDLTPMDRYIGGVHLLGPPGWRWDGDKQLLVSSPKNN